MLLITGKKLPSLSSSGAVQSLCKSCLRQLSYSRTHSKLSLDQGTGTVVAHSQMSVSQPEPNRFYHILNRYEDIIGLTDVKLAQQRTIEMERLFINAQEERKSRQDDLKRVQMRLKEIHSELDKTSRGEDRFNDFIRYLALLTDEHKLIKEERSVIEDVKSYEHDERLKFQALSAYLRESHEKERERAERTKYWSIIGSICGALIGIIGTTLSNRMRMNELRGLVSEGDGGKYKQLMVDLQDMLHAQQQQVRSFMGDMSAMLAHKSVVNAGVWHSVDQGATAMVEGESAADNVILNAMKEHELKLQQDMEQLKQMLAAEHGYKQEESGQGQTLVYVGPDMSRMLSNTASDLEAKMKMQTVVAVVAVYTALALTLPILFALSRAG